MSRNKKIIFVIPRMGGGGAERVVANISNSLSEKEYEVRIITLVSNESFYPLSDKVVIKSSMLTINKSNKVARYISMAKNLLKAVLFIRNEIKRFKPDTVVSMLIEADIITHLARMTGLNFKYICSERNDPSRRNKYLQKFLIHIYRNADYFVCQSRKVADFYTKVPNKKLAIIPNPINISLIPKSVEESHLQKIVAVGRLDPQKNFSLLIDSFLDISNKVPQSTLTIYGEGPMREILEKQILSYGLEKKVFLPGALKDVMIEIKDASLFVMSSDYEGFPNALVEAMSLGLPVISTDFSTGVAKELINENNGIVVPVNDRKALGNAIVKIMNNYQIRKRMRIENRKIINNFSLKIITNEWEKIL